jgi:hypothetical protein
MLKYTPIDLSVIPDIIMDEDMKKLPPMKLYVTLYLLLENKENIPYANFLRDLFNRYVSGNMTQDWVVTPIHEYDQNECARATEILLSHTNWATLELVELHNEISTIGRIIGSRFRLVSRPVTTINMISKCESNSLGFYPKNSLEMKLNILLMLDHLRSIFLVHFADMAKDSFNFDIPDGTILAILLQEASLMRWDNLEFDEAHFYILRKFQIHQLTAYGLLEAFHTNSKLFTEIDMEFNSSVSNWHDAWQEFSEEDKLDKQYQAYCENMSEEEVAEEIYNYNESFDCDSDTPIESAFAHVPESWNNIIQRGDTIIAFSTDSAVRVSTDNGVTWIVPPPIDISEIKDIDIAAAYDFSNFKYEKQMYPKMVEAYKDATVDENLYIDFHLNLDTELVADALDDMDFEETLEEESDSDKYEDKFNELWNKLDQCTLLDVDDERVESFQTTFFAPHIVVKKEPWWAHYLPGGHMHKYMK